MTLVKLSPLLDMYHGGALCHSPKLGYFQVPISNGYANWVYSQ